MWFYFPDTLGKPLEEIAAIFGDHGTFTNRVLLVMAMLTLWPTDEVAGYMRDIQINEEDIDAVEFPKNEKSGATKVEEHSS